MHLDLLYYQIINFLFLTFKREKIPLQHSNDSGRWIRVPPPSVRFVVMELPSWFIENLSLELLKPDVTQLLLSTEVGQRYGDMPATCIVFGEFTGTTEFTTTSWQPENVLA